MFRPSTLKVIGLLLLLIAALDPMGGHVAVVTGTGAVVLGAYLSHSEHRRLLARAFALVVVGVSGMIALSVTEVTVSITGGVLWWFMLLLYVVGWIMGLAGVALCLSDSFYEDPAGESDLAPR